MPTDLIYLLGTTNACTTDIIEYMHIMRSMMTADTEDMAKKTSARCDRRIEPVFGVPLRLLERTECQYVKILRKTHS